MSVLACLLVSLCHVLSDSPASSFCVCLSAAVSFCLFLFLSLPVSFYFSLVSLLVCLSVCLIVSLPCFSNISLAKISLSDCFTGFLTICFPLSLPDCLGLFFFFLFFVVSFSMLVWLWLSVQPPFPLCPLFLLSRLVCIFSLLLSLCLPGPSLFPFLSVTPLPHFSVPQAFFKSVTLFFLLISFSLCLTLSSSLSFCLFPSSSLISSVLSFSLSLCTFLI